MDKQKQIEEMAKTIDGILHTHSPCPFNRKCPYLGGESHFDCMRAYSLYSAGYRRIPENAVVLTREELAKMRCENIEAISQAQAYTRIKTAEKIFSTVFAEFEGDKNDKRTHKTD